MSAWLLFLPTAVLAHRHANFETQGKNPPCAVWILCRKLNISAASCRRTTVLI